MAPNGASDSTREERVNQVIAAYLKSVEEGHPSIARCSLRDIRTSPRN